MRHFIPSSLFLLITGLVMPGLLQADGSAKAVLQGTALQPKITGEATFTPTEKGQMEITVKISGATPGKHGLHIHEGSSCDNNGAAAGSHFNPEAKPHGNAIENFEHAHPGDLGNIEVDANGMGQITATLDKLTLTEGTYNIVGRAVIVHEKEDDFGQPTGNAGDRIACGLIKT